MKVTQVSIRPTDASQAAGRPALTPELLAATGARYSRSNEGLDAILTKIDPENPDASVERIFKFVDYGHASIADMAPVALFMDGISLWMAYYLWSIAPLAGGQESSTRYIRLDASGLVPFEDWNMADEDGIGWHDRMQDLFAAYEAAVRFWEDIAQSEPERMNLPVCLLADTSDKAQKTIARMRRNYAFDRARYFLPVAAQTNVMMVMSARAWVTVCQSLLSALGAESRALGAQVRDELGLVAPRLIRHARVMESFAQDHAAEHARALQLSQSHTPHAITGEAAPTPFLDVMTPPGAFDFAGDLAHRENRYGAVGLGLRRTAVRFGWEAVSFAEIRDLNRHRTGTKYCPPVPVGFYYAASQIPDARRGEYDALVETGIAATQTGLDLLRAGDPAYMYHLPLGAQFYFEHTTTADKFIYEAELRTGTGAHFRYAQHLRDVLQLWYARFPETKGLVLEGSAEPE